MPAGLDYSKRIQDEDLIAPENERERKRRKRNRKKSLSRNDSADQLSSGTCEPDFYNNFEFFVITFQIFTFATDSETETKKVSNSPVGENLKKKSQPALRSRFKGNIVARVERQLLDLQGNPVSKEVMDSLMHFRRRQAAGFIDVWWLYDDGGNYILFF